MYSFDPILLEILDGNKITLGIVFGILVGLAKISPWKSDEKILDVIVAPFKALLDTLSSKK
jgi:hypothetical protein